LHPDDEPQIKKPKARRMETMVSTNDGFEIAEVDLKLGPKPDGYFQQSGVLNLQIADLVREETFYFSQRKISKFLPLMHQNRNTPL
jgi:RecG-like helicase